VSWYQKSKTNLDFTEARDSEWQWNPLGHMQVCTSLQTDNHASSPPLSFLKARSASCRPTNSVKALKAKQQQQLSLKQIMSPGVSETICCPPMAVQLMADLHPSVDGSAGRTSFMAGQLPAAQAAASRSQHAIAQAGTDRRTDCGIAPQWQRA